MRRVQRLVVSLALPLFLWSNASTSALSLPKSRGELKDSSEDVAEVAARMLAIHKPHKLSNQLIGLSVSALIGLAADPLVELIFNVTHLTSKEGKNVLDRDTFVHGAVDSISKGARATGFLILLNLLQETFGFRLPCRVHLLQAAPRVGFVVWLTTTISTIKRTTFQRAIFGTTLGRVGLYDRLIDFVLGVGASANIMSLLGIDIGVGFRSFFAASGVSAVVFSLASKGLVEQLVSGFIVEAWDAVELGQTIRLGDGTEGTVVSIGLLETSLLQSDEVEIRIPNAHIAKQHISILSNIKTARFQQKLRFKYADLDKLTAVLDSIQDKIKQNCDEKYLIVDGSKTFRAVLTQYEPDHVEAEITCSFNLKPGSTDFVQQRQLVLLSIAQAVKAHQVDFAIPSIHYQTGGSPDAAILG